MVLPNPTAPCRASPGRTKPSPNVYCRVSPNHTCSRENSREGEPSVLLSAALAIAGHNSPLHAHPDPSQTQRTRSTLQREQQWEPKPPVLPSAAVAPPIRAMADRAAPCRIRPCRIQPCTIWIPKNPAERAEALSAEIISGNLTMPIQAPPCLYRARRTELRHVTPHLDLHHLDASSESPMLRAPVA
jgi:hypothetical protein